MCGISGIFLSDSQPVPRADIHAMNRMLAHRGPDGEGIFLDGSLGLGHRRLAVLDLTPEGQQPMSYADKRYWITCNGEIYNFLELKEELQGLGHTFRSSSDTEVILASFAQWGEDCQTRFNGMWAFAIWDAVEKRLFLSRDRFGVKPLYYISNDRGFAFASEIKAFLALSWVSPSFDDRAAASAIGQQSPFHASEHCLLQGVHRVGAGHCLSIRAGATPATRRWWNTLENLQDTPECFEDQAARFRDLFFDACRLRMRSDVTLGTTLSGGLDSSSILCAISRIQHQSENAARLARNWQKAIVACFPGAQNDEREFAEAAIRRSKAEAIYYDIDPQDIIATFNDALFSSETIDDNIGTYWLTYQRLRKSGVIVSLDGHGGDELLGGYPWHVQSARIDAVSRLPEDDQKHAELKETIDNLFPAGKWPDPLPPEIDSWKKALPYPVVCGEWEKDKLLLSGADALTRQLYYDFHYMTMPAHLTKFDHCSMAHGLEARAPFMDWRLVSYCFSLPSESKIGHGYTKYILRAAMQGVLPESIRSRKVKFGFSGALNEWVKGPLKTFLLDLAGSSFFLASDISHGPAIRDYISRCYATGDTRNLRPVWGHIQAACLKRLFGECRAKCVTP